MAFLSNISEQTYDSISHPTSQLQSTNIILSTYNGENVMIFGICDVQIDYQSQSQILSLLVMHRHGPNVLVEIDKIFKLDWNSIHFFDKQYSFP